MKTETMRYCYAPKRKHSTLKTKPEPNVGESMEKLDLPCTAGGHAK